MDIKRVELVLAGLVKQGILTEEDAKKHSDTVIKEKEPLVKYLVSKGIVKGGMMAHYLSHIFHVPFLDLSAFDLDSMPTTVINKELIEKHRVLPLYKRGTYLFIGIADPTNVKALDEVKFQTNLKIATIVVEQDKLAIAIDEFLESMEGNFMMEDLLDTDLDNVELTGGDQAEEAVVMKENDTPIIRFVNKLLLDAIKQGVSDIHLEPFEKVFRIRYRSDGMLHKVSTPPNNMAQRIISRIKIMSKMDIAERRLPQDGRLKLIMSRTRAIDFRVNTCPTLFGEKVVLRILDPTNAQLGVEKLGFEPEQKKLFIDALNQPYGMILVTGPTGSGKTVSLYTGLNMLNSIDRNISTAEDPVEITVEGINQVNMNVKAGLTFAEALRAFLRQDPDIIMVGEIRDLETGAIAVKAAQTGHLVLSTLHTNDAPQTLNRLLQMGIPAFNIVSSVILIMAQRLARRLCTECKKDGEYPDSALLEIGFEQKDIGTFTAYKAVGCDMCTNGYKGRVGIYQVMPISEAMKANILKGANAMELADQSKAEGVNDLRASGLLKIVQGVTSIEEVDRVTLA